MVLLMRLFYSHVHSLFQHTNYTQIDGDDPPIIEKCLTIVVRAMNLERPRDYNATLNLSTLYPTLKVNELIQLL